ncbi:MAG: TolC family protein [Burkholderiales bacterium]
MSRHDKSGRSRRLLGFALALTLAGCTTFSEERGFDLTRRTAAERVGGEAVWIRSEQEAGEIRAKVAALLAKPLSADDAVQVALYNNAGLQAAYSDLGISESDLVAAGRLENPRFSFMRLINSHQEVKIESVLAFGVMSLITLPGRIEAAGRRFEAVQRSVAAEMLRVAGDARRAWITAVAAQQTAAYMEQVKDSADAGAELARRMARAGNFSRLAQMREHAFYADATAQVARARHAAIAAREQLARLLGVPDAALLRLPERLPDLPGTPRGEGDIASEALRERLDVTAARLESESLAAALGLTRITRFTNVLEIGRARVDEGTEPRKRGWEVGFEIPLFDWGGARVAGAEARYLQSIARIRDTAVTAQSEVREAYAAYRTQHDLARHYREEIVPLRKKISDEMLWRYNGMLKSVFELLADAREQVMAVNSAIEAQRDFWLAEADLRTALVGKPTTLGLAAPLMPKAAAGGGGH